MMKDKKLDRQGYETKRHFYKYYTLKLQLKHCDLNCFI